jgi:acetoin utilization deacetylase AcuC-like enzyme
MALAAGVEDAAHMGGVSSPLSTGLVWDERCMWHDPGAGGGPLPAGGWIQPDVHAENPEPKRRIRNLLEVSGLLDDLVPIRARAASAEEVCRFHAEEYVARVHTMSEAGGGDAGGYTPFGPGSYEIALLSAGGCLAAVDAVLTGEVDNCYALVRPPGHHATRESGMGFCIFGNVAIAAHHARASHGLTRLAIVDWDVHHGNGTQEAFYGDPDVLTISLHQDSAFPPGSGSVEETGEGAGVGFNVNVPLPAGSGHGAYLAAMEQVILPALLRHDPELILIACGYDASGMDPLARMMLHSDSYRELTGMVMRAAGEVCGGRLVLCHEGGYSSAVTPFCGLAVLETLSGRSTDVEDPYQPLIAAMAGHDLMPHQRSAVERAAAAANPS